MAWRVASIRVGPTAARLALYGDPHPGSAGGLAAPAGDQTLIAIRCV